jgi:hypothetical protein
LPSQEKINEEKEIKTRIRKEEGFILPKTFEKRKIFLLKYKCFISGLKQYY